MNGVVILCLLGILGFNEGKMAYKVSDSFARDVEDCEFSLSGKCRAFPVIQIAMNGNHEQDAYVEVKQDFDSVLLDACRTLNLEDAEAACAPGSGARLIDSLGERMTTMDDLIAQNTVEPIYVVPRWLHFVWPTVEIGHTVYPKTDRASDEKPLSLVTLSLRPRVFQVNNFMTLEEAEGLIELNKHRIKRSTVGATASHDRTRTSSNTWDLSSHLSKRFKKRAFKLLGLDHEASLEDGLQVLNYRPGQWYKPHVDWLNPETEDVEGNLNPQVNNGTNRFATLFFYLNTVEKGGHTVFPRSTSHSYFDGNKVMRDGPANPPPGFISDRDAAWACNTSSSALRSEPVGGNAVLFYNQLPSGELDVESLHGGCPPLKGEKWAVNLWVWNRPREGAFRPVYYDLDGKKSNTPARHTKKRPKGEIHFEFQNHAGYPVEVAWLNPNGQRVSMGKIEEGATMGVKSFNSHEFGALKQGNLLNNEVFWKHVVSIDNEGQVIAIVP